MMSYFFIITLWCFIHISSPEELSYCSAGDGSCTEKTGSVLLDSDNPALLKISTALQEYQKERSLKNSSCFLDLLAKDLKPFQAGVTKDMVDKIRKRGTTYVIFQNKLYRDKDCLFPARCKGIEHFILKLKHKLSDMELVINTRDWPQVSRHFGEFGPLMSFSKTGEYYDIMYPAWSFWGGGPAISLYPTGLGRWDEHIASLTEESEAHLWPDKLEMGFFRGSRTSQERDVLVLLSRKFPDLVDAQYTKNQAWKSAADTLNAEPAKEVSLEAHCKFKYLFNFRGVAASFRFRHLFLCGSLVIHFGDEWVEFFYPALKPWVHYIPMAQDASEDDILRMLRFLREHDELAAEIALRGQRFILENLTMKKVTCYWRNLLKKYGKLLKYEVHLDPNLIQII